MRHLVLRHVNAACQHGTRSQYLHLPRLTFQQRRHKSERAAAASLPKSNIISIQPKRGAAIDTPRISTESKYAIPGLVPDLSTTRPAPLDLPEPPHLYAWPSSQSKDPSKWDFKYLFSLGKAYGKFYWLGIKNVWANYKTRQQIVRRLNGTTPDTAARYQASPQRISYNEYEMLLRSKRDLKKLVPFALVFAICGEFTPLFIVLLGSGVVPATCVIPKQIAQDRKKTLERESTFMDLMVDTWSKRLARHTGTEKQLNRKMITYLLPDAYRLHLTPFIHLTGLPVDLYWRYRLMPRFNKHSDEILSTAVLVQREGGWSKRSPQDMWEWGNKYGMYRLRQYAKEAIDRDEDPVSEHMKTALLRHFEDETQAIVQQAHRSGRFNLEHHDPVMCQKPDCVAMRRDIESQCEKKEREREQEAKVKKS